MNSAAGTGPLPERAHSVGTMFRDEALVLSSRKIGDADRVLTLLTRRNGMVDAVAKNIARTGTVSGSAVEPMTYIEVQWRRGRTLHTISTASAVRAYGMEFVAEYPVYAVACVVLEVAKVLGEQAATESAHHFVLTAGALRSLAGREHPAGLVLDAYLLRSLSLAGWPLDFQSLSLDSEVRDLCVALVEGDWLAAESSSPDTQRIVGRIVGTYFERCTEERLKTLPLVERM